MSAFNNGDVVQLKSGGPLMTVTSISTRGEGGVICQWFAGDVRKSDMFTPEALKESPPARIEPLKRS